MHLIEQGDDGGVVVSRVEIIPEIVVEPSVQLGGGEAVLQPAAHHSPALALPGGEQEQEAVVGVGISDAPGMKDLGGVFIRVHAVQKIHRHHH